MMGIVRVGVDEAAELSLAPPLPFPVFANPTQQEEEMKGDELQKPQKRKLQNLSAFPKQRKLKLLQFFDNDDEKEAAKMNTDELQGLTSGGDKKVEITYGKEERIGKRKMQSKGHNTLNLDLTMSSSSSSFFCTSNSNYKNPSPMTFCVSNAKSEDEIMLARVCIKCHMFVMFSKHSPSCPNCKCLNPVSLTFPT